MIGAAAAIQGPTEQIKAFREEVSYGNWHRIKVKLLTTVRLGGTLRKTAKEQACIPSIPELKRKSSMAVATVHFFEGAKEIMNAAKSIVKNKSSRWLKKIQGGSTGIPPSHSYRVCLWTFIGVITTHTILSRLNLFIKTESNGDLDLILAPLGKCSAQLYFICFKLMLFPH